MTSPADELRTAALTLRDVAPQITGHLAGLADPVAEWLDSWTGIELYEAGALPEGARHALAIARAVNGTAQPRP